MPTPEDIYASLEQDYGGAPQLPQSNPSDIYASLEADYGHQEPTLSPSVQESIEPTLFETTTVPSILGGALNIGNALTFGGAEQAVALGSAGAKKLGLPTPGYEEALGIQRGAVQQFRGENPVAGFTGQAAGALANPVIPGILGGLNAAIKGNKVGAAALGLGRTANVAAQGAKAPGVLAGFGKNVANIGAYGTAAGFGETPGDLSERIEGAKEGGLTALKFGVPLAGAAPLVGKAAKYLGGKAADQFERAGFGLTKPQIEKSIEAAKRFGFDDASEALLFKAISNFRTAGGGKQGYGAEKLSKSLQGQINELETSLSTRLKEASAKQTEQIVPNFTNTLKFAESRGSSEREAALRIANEEINKFLGDPNNKGRLLDWQKQKVLLGQTISNSYKKDTTQNPLRTQILQKIRQDLRETIEDNYGKLIGNPKGAQEVRELNKALGEKYLLQPVMTKLQAGEEATTLGRQALQFTKTTGGVGTQLLLGAATGNPLFAASAIGTALANTKRGNLALSDLLRATSPKISKASAVTPEIAGRLASTFGVDSVKDKSLKGKAPSTPVIVSATPKKFDVDKAVKQYSAKYDLPEKLVRAQVKKESSGKVNALSPKGAFGLLQLMPATAKEMAEELGETYDRNDPDQNLRLGTAYLSKLKKRYKSLPLALAAYNWGLGNLDKAIARAGTRDIDKIKLPDETRDYVDKLRTYLV
jgi:soluble lytic murein transglycosylase-like protein